MGSAVTHAQPTATQRPRPQAVRARGASRLPLCFSAKPSPRAPWAWGLLSAFWERGSPDLPACGMAQVGAQLKTLARGQASRGG